MCSLVGTAALDATHMRTDPARVMGDEQSTIRINQKFNELLNEAVITNPHGDPGEIVKVTYDTLIAWGRSINIAVSGMSQELYDTLVRQVWVSQVHRNVNKTLQELIAKNSSPTDRNMTPLPPREAVRKSIDELADWVRSMNYPINAFAFDSEEEFEKLVKQVEKMIETFRVNQEKGATPLGQHGVYIDTLADDEYHAAMKRAGLEP